MLTTRHTKTPSQEFWLPEERLQYPSGAQRNKIRHTEQGRRYNFTLPVNSPLSPHSTWLREMPCTLEQSHGTKWREHLTFCRPKLQFHSGVPSQASFAGTGRIPVTGCSPWTQAVVLPQNQTSLYRSRTQVLDVPHSQAHQNRPRFTSALAAGQLLQTLTAPKFLKTLPPELLLLHTIYRLWWCDV